MGAQLADSRALQPGSAEAKVKAKAKAKAAAATAPDPKDSVKAESVPAAAAAKAAAKPEAAAAPVDSEWSTEQQKALEVALQKPPASLDKNERWKLIAADVPGKTKAQCVERFKWIREQL